MIQAITDQATLETIKKSLLKTAYDQMSCPHCQKSFMPLADDIDHVFQAIDLMKDAPKRLFYQRVSNDNQSWRVTAPVADFEEAVTKAHAFVKLTGENNVIHNFWVEEYQGKEKGWQLIDLPPGVAARLGDA